MDCRLMVLLVPGVDDGLPGSLEIALRGDQGVIVKRIAVSCLGPVRFGWI
jgi:hypothetical protein